MDSRGQVRPGSPFPWVLLLVAAGGGTFFLSQRALESSRPSAAQQAMLRALGEEDVQARLWQDPFDALTRHQEDTTDHSKGTEADDHSKGTEADDHSKGAEADQKGQPSTDQKQEDQAPRRAKVGKVHHGIDAIAQRIAHRVKLSSGASSTKEGPPVTVLPVMVPGAPYANDAEERLRSRHAVLSALGVAGYSPEDGEHIGFFEAAWPKSMNVDGAVSADSAEPTNKQKALPLLGPCTGAETCCLRVPYEWFERIELPAEHGSGSSRHILVLWLRDDAFATHPLARLAQLVDALRRRVEEVPCSPKDDESQLQAGRDAVAFAVLGPAGSTTLRAMAREAFTQPVSMVASIQTQLEGVRIYSPRATASDELLLKNDSLVQTPSEAKSPHLAIAPGRFFGAFLVFYERIKNLLCSETGRARTVADAIERLGPVLIRTTCTDDQLLGALVEELALRGVDVGNADHRVVLISEWDTFYGRAMAETLLRVVTEANGETEKEAPSPGGGPMHVCEKLRGKGIERVSYLRGLDGRLPGESTKAPERREAEKAKGVGTVKYLERPEGRGQLDYVRRLVQRLETLPLTEGDDAGDREIKAIGVLGSDVYDKLLILQALRKRFRRAVFFTTDLDARLLCPDEFPWARNLIVASGFGLELRDRLQSHIPPFRGTYQTATYLACLTALEHHALPENLECQGKSLFQYLRPRVFEIGRRGAHQLRIAPQKELDPSSGSVSPKETPESGDPCFAQEGQDQLNAAPQQKPDLRPESPSLTAIAAIGELRCTEDAELLHPPDPTQWPTLSVGLAFRALCVVMMFVLALTLVVMLSFKANAMWKRAWGFARKRPLSVLAVALLLLGFAAVIVTEHFGGLGEPFSLTQGISIWPSLILRVLVAILCLCFLVTASTNLRESDQDLSRDFGLAPPPCRIELGSWKHEKGGVFAEKLWGEYLDRGTVGNRAWRYVPMAAMLLAFNILLINALGFPHTPYRGSTSAMMNGVTLLISVPLLLVVLFFVVDATRLCSSFIADLVREPTGWPDKAKEMFNERRAMHAEDLREWLDVQLIARRTATVGSLIIWPFVALFLMIISRLRYFDDWSTPVGLSIVLLVFAACVIYCAVCLTHAAKRARRQALDNLRENLIRVSGDTPEEKKRRRQIRETIDEIESLREGAFVPWTQHPVVQALILPAGGIGLALLELF